MTNPAQTSEPLAPRIPSRFEWLDAWRGLAVMWMIQTHCFNAFMDAEWTKWPSYHSLNYANGLVAPSFLFIAGFVQGYAIRRVWDRGEIWQITRSRLLRLGLIFSLGYALRLPVLLSMIGKGNITQLLVDWLCVVDILSCLGASLACILGIARICQNGKNFDRILALLACGCVILSPIANDWTHENPFVQLGLTWMNRNYDALFPLLPWFGFAALGALFSRWRSPAKAFLIGSIVAFVFSRFLPPMGAAGNHVEPAFFMSRLGWVLLIGTGFACCRLLSAGKLLLLVGQKSLLFYIVHLQIIYAYLLNQPWLQTMPPVSKVILSMILTFFGSFAVAWLVKMSASVIPRRSA